MARNTEEIIAEIADKYAAEQRDSFFEQFDNQCYDTEKWSPIEKMMANGLLYALMSREHFAAEGGINEFAFSRDIRSLAETDFSWKGGMYGVLIYPQMKIGKYCADFVVNMKAHLRNHVIGVIECDGHDYHEKNKRQAQHDKERDRFFQSLGLFVLRYTGSEIYRDPVKCAVDGLNILFGHANKRNTEGR